MLVFGVFFDQLKEHQRKIRPPCWHQFSVQGAPGCKHFLLGFWQQTSAIHFPCRPEMPFVCQCRIVSDPAFLLAPWKQEEPQRALGRYSVKEGRLSPPVWTLKHLFELLRSGFWWADIVFVCLFFSVLFKSGHCCSACEGTLEALVQPGHYQSASHFSLCESALRLNLLLLRWALLRTLMDFFLYKNKTEPVSIRYCVYKSINLINSLLLHT